MKTFLNLPSTPPSQILFFSPNLLTIPTTNAPQDANAHPGTTSQSSKEPNQQLPRRSGSATRSTTNLQPPNHTPARSPAPAPQPLLLTLLTIHPPPAPPTPLHPTPHHLTGHEGRRPRNLLGSDPLSSLRPAANHSRPSAATNTATLIHGGAEDELAGYESPFAERGVEVVEDN